MKTVIILGGYGGFGARLSRRLADDGWRVLVAGRNQRSAVRFAAQLPGAEPLLADRTTDLRPILTAHRPSLLIDAAGPFQSSGYHVAEACIACGVHYLDLADARDFVGGIGRLDAQACAQGVVVIAGASSVPALSGAVIAKLSRDMDEVRSVTMSIGASNRAAAGPSVAAAILSYVGKPVRIWRGGRWQQATGWQSVERVTYRVSGRAAMSRFVALSDVPDHDIVPAMVKGRPATAFRAGPELSFQLGILWLLSWPVKWGWIRSLLPFSRWLLPLQKLTARVGSDRSAMKVEVKGSAGGTLLVRSWTLIAEDGHGLEIPTIAAHLLAGAVAEGRIRPGARAAAGEIPFEAFTPQLDRLSIFREIESRSYVPLYRRAMGPAFEALPAPVRDMHTVIGDAGASGVATVLRGRSPLAWLVATMLRFPPGGDHGLHVSFDEKNGKERWTRDFDGYRFSSEISQSRRGVKERFGPMRFDFELHPNAAGLQMTMCGWSVFGIPMPLIVAPICEAKEWADGADFHFDIRIALPGHIEIIRYQGRLRLLTK